MLQPVPQPLQVLQRGLELSSPSLPRASALAKICATRSNLATSSPGHCSRLARRGERQAPRGSTSCALSGTVTVDFVPNRLSDASVGGGCRGQLVDGSRPPPSRRSAGASASQGK
ncbi:MAG: hypothetical protein MZV64_05050 [Ignavibacteriales bacterium]|nr:hypothetical protein [Ignavibacteriales bacterium]